MKKARTVGRFILGNLDGFEPEHAVSYDQLSALDKYTLHGLSTFMNDCEGNFNDFDFYKVNKRLRDYLSDLSSLYLDVSKDRLYCDDPNSLSRRATQTILFELLAGLLTVLAPAAPQASEGNH